MDPKVTAKVHYDEMALYLENHLFQVVLALIGLA